MAKIPNKLSEEQKENIELIRKEFEENLDKLFSYNEHRHNIIHYYKIRKSIDLIVSFWNNLNEIEKKQLNIKIKKIGQKYLEQYNLGKMNLSEVINAFNDETKIEFNNLEIINGIFQIFYEYINASNSQSKPNFLKGILSNNISDYFEFFINISNLKENKIKLKGIDGKGKEVRAFYNYGFKKTGLNNSRYNNEIWNYDTIDKILGERILNNLNLLQIPEIPNFEKMDSKFNKEIFKKNLIIDKLIYIHSENNKIKNNQNNEQKQEIKQQNNSNRIIEQSNQLLENKKQIILYGPPGTGKTFNTQNIIKEHSKNEDYSKLEQENRIKFITFHQSFAYEEFIEGLKPKLNEDNENNEIQYEISKGIFKEICEKAILENIAKNEEKNNINLNIDLNKINFFKLSLGNTLRNENEIYEYCIENNLIALGYGANNDFSNLILDKTNNRNWDSKLWKEFKIKFDMLNLNNISNDKLQYTKQAIYYFTNYMKIGDLVFISNGNKKLRAIGIIESNYIFNENTEISYNHFRKVKWLLKDIDIDVKKFNEKYFSQMTLYQLNNLNINNINKIILDSNFKLNFDKIKKNNLLNNFYNSSKDHRNKLFKNSEPYYLIIDEINRGNISKILGELITLLEADKRLGGDNELITELPYSKEKFGIPPNLFIIATMNTSDKSIANLDIALRRRFGFVEILPNPRLIEISENCEGINLQKLLEQLNKRIKFFLDKDHMIGHSYFMNIKTIEKLKQTFYNEIIPLLEEYFYGEQEKLIAVLGSGFFEEIKINKDNNLFEKKVYGDLIETDLIEYNLIDFRKNSNNDLFENAIKKIIDINNKTKQEKEDEVKTD